MIPNLPPGADAQAILSAFLAPGAFPGTFQPPVQIPGVVTMDQVNALITTRLRELTPTPAPATPTPAPAAAPQPDLSKLGAVIQQVDGLARRALSAEDYEFMKSYLAGGSPGFADMMASEALNPIVQLLCETIKERKP